MLSIGDRIVDGACEHKRSNLLGHISVTREGSRAMSEVYRCRTCKCLWRRDDDGSVKIVEPGPPRPRRVQDEPPTEFVVVPRVGPRASTELVAVPRRPRASAEKGESPKQAPDEPEPQPTSAYTSTNAEVQTEEIMGKKGKAKKGTKKGGRKANPGKKQNTNVGGTRLERALADKRCPAPGKFLRRELKGKVCEAQVTKEGFIYKGKTYDTPTTIATKFVREELNGSDGTRRPGWAFFFPEKSEGTKPRGRPKKSTKTAAKKPTGKRRGRPPGSKNKPKPTAAAPAPALAPPPVLAPPPAPEPGSDLIPMEPM